MNTEFFYKGGAPDKGNTGHANPNMLLMKLHGYTERDIAEKYGCTVGTVHNTVQRVIANIRSEFLKDVKVLGIELPKGNHSNLFM